MTDPVPTPGSLSAKWRVEAETAIGGDELMWAAKDLATALAPVVAKLEQLREEMRHRAWHDHHFIQGATGAEALLAWVEVLGAIRQALTTEQT